MLTGLISADSVLPEEEVRAVRSLTSVRGVLKKARIPADFGSVVFDFELSILFASNPLDL